MRRGRGGTIQQMPLVLPRLKYLGRRMEVNWMIFCQYQGQWWQTHQLSDIIQKVDSTSLRKGNMRGLRSIMGCSGTTVRDFSISGWVPLFIEYSLIRPGSAAFAITTRSLGQHIRLRMPSESGSSTWLAILVVDVPKRVNCRLLIDDAASRDQTLIFFFNISNAFASNSRMTPIPL